MSPEEALCSCPEFVGKCLLLLTVMFCPGTHDSDVLGDSQLSHFSKLYI